MSGCVLVDDGVVDTIKYRVKSRLPIDWLREYGVLQGYIAGNSLNRETPLTLPIFKLGRSLLLIKAGVFRLGKCIIRLHGLRLM